MIQYQTYDFHSTSGAKEGHLHLNHLEVDVTNQKRAMNYSQGNQSSTDFILIAALIARKSLTTQE